MFIDYVTLLLINMVCGLFVLAHFAFYGLDAPQGEPRRWWTAFGVTGLVALVGGFHMVFTWPLPGPYNSAFGEMSVLFGAVYLGLGLALLANVSLAPIGVYAFFAGLAAVVLGARIIDLGMTQSPNLSGIGFIATGLGGMLLCLVLRLRSSKMARTIFAVLLVIAALIWSLTGYMALWGHMHPESFGKWKPATLQAAPPPRE